MPSDELGDRVHNFFAQDNSLQGNSQIVEGNWPVLNNSFWVGSQRQVESLSSNNSQNLDVDRGGGNYTLHVTHGMNFSLSNLIPGFAKSHSQNEQPNLNGSTCGNQFHQSRPSEDNFLAMDLDSNQRQLVTSRSLFVRDLQVSGADRAPVSLDLFGGQQQMIHHQSDVPQSLSCQQSGVNDMQHQQQQLMIRKMQELQRQQQLQQLDLRQQNFMNQVSPFAKQITGNQSTLVNGTLSSDTLQNPWTAEIGINWRNRGSPSMQGSPSGPGFSPNLAQTQQLLDLVPQQADQSLYGVPVPSTTDFPADQYNQMVGIQDESSISRHKIQSKNIFGLASRQASNTGITNLGPLQQVNSMSKAAPHQDFLGRQEQVGRLDISHEKPTRQVASPQNEVALDPAEERILFGSDDNIWAAFGKVPNMSGEVGNSFNSGGLSNCLSSVQSGSWSALMQSAVAETSSSDIAPQEEWGGLTFHINDSPSGNQPPSVHNDSDKQDASLADDNMQMPQSFPLSDDASESNARTNQLGQKFQNGPGQRLQSEMSSCQSSEKVGKWSNSGVLQKPVSVGGQIRRDASHHPFQAERNAKTNSPSWVPGQIGTGLQSNGWNAMAVIPPGRDRMINAHEAERLQHNSQNSQVRVVQGDVAHGSSLWNSNASPGSAIELDHVNSRVGNSQASQGSLGLKEAGISGESSPFIQSNYVFNQWKNAHPPGRSQEGENLGRIPYQANNLNQVFNSMNSREMDEVARHEMVNYDGKENSSDSHRSNLSQHTFGRLGEGGLSDLGESQSLPTGRKKLTNQLSRKVSAPRKFQYHPMGNLDKDVDPTYGLKQPTHVQAMSQQSAHFGQKKIFGHVPGSSTVMEKGLSSGLHRDVKGPDEEPSHDLSGPAPNWHLTFSRPGDTYSTDKASASSQNMLKLLHKADPSRNHGAMMQFSSSDCNTLSQLPEAETIDGTGLLQRSQSSVSQGFGLQLGPPSQRLHIPNHSFSSQNDQGTFNYSYSSNDAAKIEDKGQQMVALHSVQSSPSVEESEVEFKLNRSLTSSHGRNGNFLYKTPGNSNSAPCSGTLYSRNNIPNQPLNMVSEESLNGHAFHSARRSAETLPDVARSFCQHNPGSSEDMSGQSGPRDAHDRVPAATVDGERSPKHFAMPAISPHGDSAQVLHNMWTNVPTHQLNMGVQFQQVSSHILEPSLPHIVESSLTPSIEGDVNSEGVVDGEVQRLKKSSGQPVASVKTDPVLKMKSSLGKASAMKNGMDDSPGNSPSTQKDIEAFGRSLKPNSVSYQNYSLSKHMDALKDAETGPSNRASKRMKGPENIAEVHQVVVKAGQQSQHSALVGDSLGSSAGVLHEDSKTPGFSRPADILQKSTSEQGNIASQEALGLSGDVSQSCYRNDYVTSVRIGHRQVSPQMAPSWFNQYGTFKNEQMLPIYDTRKIAPSRPVEPPFTIEKSPSGLDTLNSEEKGTTTPTDACQTDNSHQKPTPSIITNGQFPSQSAQLNVTCQHPVILGPVKRKSATSELHSWHKEISEGAQDLLTPRKAEVDWNKVANHLPEKVQDDAELIGDGPPALRSKSRLILSTCLMQQLLRPAPAASLHADATGYDIVAYAVSRTALGDACSMLSCSNSLNVPYDGMDRLLEKGKSAEINGDRCYAKSTEELMGRARMLENDLLRLDKSASILDLRVECQDMEKFSVVNRFARFHGRGQTDAETTSTDGTANNQKPIPQRYVTASPMPRSFPDRVQCLSLE